MHGDERRQPPPRLRWPRAELPLDGQAPNPLVRGTIILTILAMVAGFLAFGPDSDDPQTLVAGRLESAAGASVEAVTGGAGGADSDPSDAFGTADTEVSANQAGVDPEIALGFDPDRDGLRYETLADLDQTLAPTTTAPATTTTEPSTTVTTVPPTQAPTTPAPTEAPTTEPPPPTEAPPADAPAEETGSVPDAAATEAPPEPAADPPAEAAPPVTEAPVAGAPEGWVDAGHGVFVPPVLLAIRFCESTDNYTAANPHSSARGAYQFLTSSWAAYGHKDRYGVTRAHQATPAQQDEAAVITWERDGTRPWNASKHCWSKRI
jgi:hypothetical protein